MHRSFTDGLSLQACLPGITAGLLHLVSTRGDVAGILAASVFQGTSWALTLHDGTVLNTCRAAFDATIVSGSNSIGGPRVACLRYAPTLLLFVCRVVWVSRICSKRGAQPPLCGLVLGCWSPAVGLLAQQCMGLSVVCCRRRRQLCVLGSSSVRSAHPCQAHPCSCVAWLWTECCRSLQPAFRFLTARQGKVGWWLCSAGVLGWVCCVVKAMAVLHNAGTCTVIADLGGAVVF
jgi:hypothetical protein